jgi:uncharacterized membrane protein (DUF373 family)
MHVNNATLTLLMLRKAIQIRKNLKYESTHTIFLEMRKFYGYKDFHQRQTGIFFIFILCKLFILVIDVTLIEGFIGILQ